MRVLFRFTFLFNLQPYYVVLTLYFSHILHSFALGASVWAAAQITQAVLEIPTGIISDRIGRVVSMRIGALSSLVGLIIFALSPPYPFLLIGAALQGLSFALFSGNNNAFVYDSARYAGNRDKFSNYYSKMNIALEFAGILSAITGTVLAAISYSLVMWGVGYTAVTSCASYILAY
jgi:MFS family permease